MKKSVFLSIVFFFCFSGIYSQEVPLEPWAHNHPEASTELGNWVKRHPGAAHRLFEWDSKHPFKSQELVNWAVAHPKERLGVFLQEHRDWQGIEIFTTRHADAMEEFLFWCRNHALAAKALMAHSGGLAWAGDHLYKEYWNMETPRKR